MGRMLVIVCVISLQPQDSSNNSIKNRRLIAIKKGTKQATQAVTFKERERERERLNQNRRMKMNQKQRQNHKQTKKKKENEKIKGKT